jgi:hypothetical protein
MKCRRKNKTKKLRKYKRKWKKIKKGGTEVFEMILLVLTSPET